LRNELSKLKDFSREELDIIKTYLKEFEEMQEKINHIQTKNMMAIKNMKEMLNK
jgi:Asp-tRNA(Asn)/Glu-tRNA(Gln) amidotransferase C subunit